MVNKMSKKRILTGDRPTGRLHIGHYFGSIKTRLKLQENDEYEPFILIADVQALTDNFNNPENVRELAIDYLSCGIDPNKTTIYIQSMIPETAELTVFYSNLVTIARLQRNPTVKTEIAQKKELFGESVTYGFLGYPVSQAADITCFDGELIPVGEDQLPLIEQCREIVRKFNSIYGKDVLKEPKEVLSGQARIKGLDGNEKMGKSLGNAIYLSDSPEEITKKVMGAVTDPGRIKKDDLGNPDICMVAYYHKLFTKEDDYKKVCEECRAGKRGCVACKKQLARNINTTLEPIREKRKYYEEHLDEVYSILKEGTTKANEKANKTLKEVKTLLNDVSSHYSEDNIDRRNRWMQWVNDKTEVYDKSIDKLEAALSNVAQVLKDNTKMTEEMFVQNSRDRIIDFANKAGDKDAVVSREEFNRIFKVHKKYEDFLAERNLTNGEVDIAYRIIKDSYEGHMRNHSFVEDIRGYNN